MRPLEKIRRALGGSLFVKIYLTFLAGLVAIVLTGGLVFFIGQKGEGSLWKHRRNHFLMEMIPAGPNRQGQQDRIDLLARALQADISLYAADGTLIAAAGAPLTLARGSDEPDQDGRGQFSMQLPDGRMIEARFRSGWNGGGPHPLLYLLVIAAVMAAVAWPVVRHLTRRLERLREGAEAWGAGNLSVRVAEKGTDEVATLARSFNAAADRIEELLKAHRDLLAHASHELRSPLARLRIAIDLYEERGGDQARREIIANLSELDALVEEILLGSRLDHQLQAPVLEQIDLLALVAEEGARYGIEVGGTPVSLKADPRLMRRLAANLMQNALRHGAPPVSVDMQVTGGLARLDVRDSGKGLPPGEAENVFKPF